MPDMNSRYIILTPRLSFLSSPTVTQFRGFNVRCSCARRGQQLLQKTLGEERPRQEEGGIQEDAQQQLGWHSPKLLQGPSEGILSVKESVGTSVGQEEKKTASNEDTSSYIIT